MEATELTELIRSTSFGEKLPEGTVRRLATRVRCRSVKRGTVLFREGEEHDGFYLVRSGHVVLEMCLAGRGCTRLLTVGPGEVLAWSSVLGDGRMTAAAIAQDEVELLEMSGRELAAACEADHELGFHVMRQMAAALSKRLTATRLQLLDMFQTEAESRR